MLFEGKISKAGTGSLVLSGFTCKLSLVNGTAFITNPSVTLLPFIGSKITLNDGSKNLVGWIKAVGTGETLGSELITDWTNNGYEILTLSGTDITQAVETGTAGRVYKQTASLYQMLVKVVIGAFTQTSGEKPNLGIGCTDLNLASSPAVYWGNTWGVATPIYLAFNLDNDRHGFRNTAAADWAASGITMKQVTAPSATGVTIVSTKMGATYNWVSDGGINPNATSFTATITVT